MSENYDVLPLPTHIGSVIDKQNNRLKPFVAVYFPVEILNKMKWDRKARLTLSIEKGHLKIYQNDSGEEYFTNELVYEPIEDEF